MHVQTIQKVLWFALLLSLLGVRITAQTIAEPAQLTISVHNDAKVPAGALASAEVTAARIFLEAGLSVKWISCVPSAEATPEPVPCSEAVFPSHLQVRIISRSRNLARSTFGVSYLAADGTGCYSDVFFWPVAILHSAYGQDIGSILGHVMAHEIAHLLLGINSHSQFGIMRARWQREELLRASKGELVFTEGESLVMRQRLSSLGRQSVGD